MMVIVWSSTGPDLRFLRFEGEYEGIMASFWSSFLYGCLWLSRPTPDWYNLPQTSQLSPGEFESDMTSLDEVDFLFSLFNSQS